MKTSFIMAVLCLLITQSSLQAMDQNNRDRNIDVSSNLLNLHTNIVSIEEDVEEDDGFDIIENPTTEDNAPRLKMPSSYTEDKFTNMSFDDKGCYTKKGKYRKLETWEKNANELILIKLKDVLQIKKDCFSAEYLVGKIKNAIINSNSSSNKKKFMLLFCCGKSLRHISSLGITIDHEIEVYKPNSLTCWQKDMLYGSFDLLDNAKTFGYENFVIENRREQDCFMLTCTEPFYINNLDDNIGQTIDHYKKTSNAVSSLKEKIRKIKEKKEEIERQEHAKLEKEMELNQQKKDEEINFLKEKMRNKYGTKTSNKNPYGDLVKKIISLKGIDDKNKKKEFVTANGYFESIIELEAKLEWFSDKKEKSKEDCEQGILLKIELMDLQKKYKKWLIQKN